MNSQFRGLISLCLVLAPAAAADSTLPSLEFVANRGFCSDGTWMGAFWPGERRPAGLYIWGSFCGPGDANVGHAESQEFLAPPVMNLFLAGYPGLPGRSLSLKNLQSGEETELRPPSQPGNLWRFDTLPVPPEWVGKPVQLIAEDSATKGDGWFAFSVPFLPPSSLLPVIDTTPLQSGFCPDGAYSTTKWPNGVRPPGIVTWGSFCKSGDKDTGWMASQPFAADSYVTIYTAGYPGGPGLRLAVENLQARRQLLLQVPTVGEKWQLHHFRLPEEWNGQSVRIIAQDQTTQPTGWLAFSEPVATGFGADAHAAAKTLWLTCMLGVILFIPSAAACMLAACRGIKDFLDLTAIAFLTLGFTGYAAFWMYFCGRGLGAFYCYAGLLACCAAIGYVSLAKSYRSKLAPARQLIAPGILVILAGVFIVSLGLLHGGENDPLARATDRFGPPGLASDNALPKILADDLYAQHIPKPFVGDWLSSDRPPLQAGNVLWIYPWTSGNRDIAYLALSVILQCSFLAGLWSFLTVCNVDRKPLVLALATCLFSGLTFLNGFFTWPKLFPAGFLLIAAAYLLTDRYYLVRDRMTIGAVVGAAVAFAMLCHGSSMFAVLGIAAYMLLVRRYPSRAFLTGLAAGLVLLNVPWMLYQKFYDPPGDRLLKWHLAGVIPPHPEASFTGLLFNSYRNLKPSELMELKVGNFTTIAGDLPQHLGDIGRFSDDLAAGLVDARNTVAGRIRLVMLLHWIPSIGLSMLGPLALLLASLLRRMRGAEFAAAWRMWLVTGLTLLLWPLIMFGPTATIPIQGTYFTEILAFAASCLAFWAVRPWLAVGIAAVQISWNALLFIWLTPALPPLGVGVDSGPINSFLGVACLLSATAIFALLANFASRPAANREAAA